jgi:formylmethanofuran dehydrogenase subunit A
MKVLLLTSLLGVAAGASSLTTYRLVHDVGSPHRYEMQVLAQERAVVTLDRETGVVRYIYGPHSNVPPAQWAIEFKPGAQMAQIAPPTPPEKR